MRAAPSRHRAALSSPPVRPADPKVLNQALSQSNQVWYADDERHPECATAVSIQRPRRADARGEKHAQADEQVPQHLGIARQRIGQQNVSELPILRLSYPANADPLERRKRSAPAIPADERYRRNEAYDKDEEVKIRQDLPACSVLGAAACENPEEEERERKRNGEERRDAVAGEVMRRVVR